MLTIFMHVALKSTKNSEVPSSSKLLLDVGITVNVLYEIFTKDTWVKILEMVNVQA